MGHLRRARDLPGRRRGHRALEARRPAHRRTGGRRAGTDGGRHGGRRMTLHSAPAPWSAALGATLLALLLAALALAPASAHAQAARPAQPLEFRDRAEEQRFHQLTLELRCVMCQNQSLADSDAPIAHDLRREVFNLMREGRSDAEIKTFLVGRYGEFVLYRPQFGGATLLLWLAPAVVLLAGVAVVVVVVRTRAAANRRALDPVDDGQEW